MLYIGRMKKNITLLILLLSISGFSQEAEMIEINIDETQKKELVKLNYLLKDKAIFKRGDDALLNFYKEKSKHEILDFDINDILIIYTLKIDEEGKPYELEIQRSPSKEHTEELKRLVSIMPNWKPAKKDGELVKAAVVSSLVMRIKE